MKQRKKNMKDITNYPVMSPVFEVSETSATDRQATLVIEPLENGYGHTLGNALRRIVLTSLPGVAVTLVRIDGVDHQYTGIEGISEDVIEILLNIKSLRIKSTTSAEEGVLRLNASGAGDVTAADIKCDAGFEIVNKNQVIATLAKGKTLDIELTVESGLGYVMAGNKETSVIGEIPVDALFSPVTKASYKVEATRVGRRTDYDRIVFDITTDGTITPAEALNQAARVLAKQATQVFDPVLPEVEVQEETLSPEEAETLRLTVEELDLPTRIANALRKGGFETVGDLQGAPRDVIAKVKNLGEKSVDVINDALVKKGVTLGE
jgi:DNA-directed RNA polymerase subunit alpha